MVYIEVIFFNNLAIDVFLIVNSLILRKRKLSKIRIAFSSIIGAVGACAYLFVPNYIKIVIKILLAPLMSVIFDKYKSVKDYLLSTMTFVVMTFLFGGILFGIQNLVGVELTKYLLLSFVLFSMLIAETVTLALVKTAAKRRKIFKNATIFLGAEKLELRALYDSGNALSDGVSDLPVAVLSKSGQNKLNALDMRKNEIFVGFISAKTVSGKTEMPLVKIDKLIVDNAKYDCLVALSDNDFDDCEIILHNSMIGGKINETKRSFAKDFKIFQR